MGRTEARVFTSIWRDPAFLGLSPNAQRLYMFLLSQEDLNYAGVLPLRPPRWAPKARGLTVEDIETGLAELEGDGRLFVVMDQETGELFVRSLIRRDQIWQQPNLLKSARAAARQIESPAIRAALRAELLRLPIHESSSTLVKRVHADFLADLEETTDNPSPNPSRKGTEKGSGDPSANPAQGKGDGYGPAVEGAPFPVPPSPVPQGRMVPLWPAVIHNPPTWAEGAQNLDQTQDELAHLVAEVRAIRPDWASTKIRRVLTQPSVAERPADLVRLAVLAMARRGDSEHPGRLAGDGPWWAEARAAMRQTPEPADPWCGDCDPRTRLIGDDSPRRCPVCNPNRKAS